MDMNVQKILVGAIVASVVSACSSSGPEASSAATLNVPQWVLNPYVEGGIAAADCVKYSGNLSIDSKMSTANGRVALSQQISTQVESLDKTYASRVDSNEEVTTGTNFSSVSKQLTKNVLNGSRAIKTDIIEIAGQNHVCTLVAIEPDKTRELFDKIVTESKRQLSPQDEKFLYQEFKAHKAEQDLDREIEKLTN